MMTVGEKMKQLALELVRIKSVVGTDGELDMAEAVYQQLKAIPYFQANPQLLADIKIDGDSRGRRFIKAVILADRPAQDAVLCLGHFDTVGIDDYGECKDFAVQPDVLKDKLRQLQLDAEVQAALDSPDWLFGRGLLDMKAGVAAHILMAEHFSTRTAQLKANIVFVFVPDEEGDSVGMRAAVEELASFASVRNWRLLAAVNTDYMTDRYPGDDHKYVYVGTVGKLLPSFYVYGKETHVGEAFNGIDANLLAAEILRQIDLAPDLCDVVENEVTMPPVSLHQRDLKAEYSVQTANAAVLYFNYVTQISEPDQVLEKCRLKALASFQNVITRLNEQYEQYCRLSRIPFQPLAWQPQVLTYEELYRRVRAENGPELDELISRLSAELKAKGADDREFSLTIVREVHRRYSNQDPLVVVYFAPPYYPHIYVQDEGEREQKLMAAVDGAIAAARQLFDYRITVKKFFPYISDLSFCGIPSRSDTIAKLTDNMPAWDRTYYLPLAAMNAIRMPVINIGPYGRDAHKLTERIAQSYSFDAMPFILQATLENLILPAQPE